MQLVVKLSTLAALFASTGIAIAQWTGPFAPDSRLIYDTGPVYVGGILDTSRFNIAESASGSRIIGLHSYIGTPGNGARTTALWGETNNPKGRGLQGFNFATADSGDSNNPAAGIWAETASVTGQGIRARATASTGSSYAGYFDNASSSGTGVYGVATNIGSGQTMGVRGVTASSSGYGVRGEAASVTGASVGVYGVSFSNAGIGMSAYTPSSSGTTYGLISQVISGNGYSGYFLGGRNYFEGSVGIGTNAPSTKLDVTGNVAAPLIIGTNSTTANSSSYTNGYAAVKGVLSSIGATGTAAGVAGITNSTGSNSFGVLGFHAGNGIGVFGIANGAAGYGLWGSANSGGEAGHFAGNVNVLGTLAKSGGSFKIDHPLDPENKFLYHSFVESPDMMNIYNGVVTTDAGGEATIAMPEYFEALNQDFRYQLTIIDESDSGWAMAKVVSRIKDNHFSIRTNLPNQTVSWQVTGIRHDAWANQNRIPVEVAKSKSERGLYLHPSVFNLPPDRSLDYKILHPQGDSTAQAAAATTLPAPAPVRVNPPALQMPSANTPPLVPAVQGGREDSHSESKAGALRSPLRQLQRSSSNSSDDFCMPSGRTLVARERLLEIRWRLSHADFLLETYERGYHIEMVFDSSIPASRAPLAVNPSRGVCIQSFLVTYCSFGSNFSIAIRIVWFAASFVERPDWVTLSAMTSIEIGCTPALESSRYRRTESNIAGFGDMGLSSIPLRLVRPSAESA